MLLLCVLYFDMINNIFEIIVDGLVSIYDLPYIEGHHCNKSCVIINSDVLVFATTLTLIAVIMSPHYYCNNISPGLQLVNYNQYDYTTTANNNISSIVSVHPKIDTRFIRHSWNNNTEMDLRISTRSQTYQIHTHNFVLIIYWGNHYKVKLLVSTCFVYLFIIMARDVVRRRLCSWRPAV